MKWHALLTPKKSEFAKEGNLGSLGPSSSQNTFPVVNKGGLQGTVGSLDTFVAMPAHRFCAEYVYHRDGFVCMEDWFAEFMDYCQTHALLSSSQLSAMRGYASVWKQQLISVCKQHFGTKSIQCKDGKQGCTLQRLDHHPWFPATTLLHQQTPLFPPPLPHSLAPTQHNHPTGPFSLSAWDTELFSSSPPSPFPPPSSFSSPLHEEKRDRCFETSSTPLPQPLPNKDGVSVTEVKIETKEVEVEAKALPTECILAYPVVTAYPMPPEDTCDNTQSRAAAAAAPNRTKKKKISKNLRDQVWTQYIGPTFGSYRCLCCKNNMIYQGNFHVGHVVSEYHGGTQHIDNLRPICSPCNLGMGTTNMRTYIVDNGFIL